MKAQNKTVLVTGSITFDTVFGLTTPIRDQVVVKDGKASKQNLMFNALDKTVYFGGTAGNIAYGLGLLRKPSIMVSVAGKDFGEYKQRLEERGTDARVLIDKSRYTATFYGMTDPRGEQIGVFQGNAYHNSLKKVSLKKILTKSDWDNIAIGIFAAGTAESINRDLTDFKKLAPKNSLSIFDPGQMLMISFTRPLALKAIKNCDMLILNDTELSHLRNKFNITLEDIFKMKVKYVIETKGSEGSTLHEQNRKTDVKALKIKKSVDPTGAGDAFRAGLISGLIDGKSITDSMRIGSILGAKCVETKGCQTYRLSK